MRAPRLGSSQSSSHNQTDPLPRWRLVAVRSPGTLSAARHIIVQGIALLRRQPARDLAHDRNDLLHEITAGAAISSMHMIVRAMRFYVLVPQNR
jgi:hypothetical protein